MRAAVPTRAPSEDVISLTDPTPHGTFRVVVGSSPIEQAEVAESVDALASGASGGNPVEVQVLSSAPSRSDIKGMAPDDRIHTIRTG